VFTSSAAWGLSVHRHPQQLSLEEIYTRLSLADKIIPQGTPSGVIKNNPSQVDRSIE
jgi:hypothetical protein